MMNVALNLEKLVLANPVAVRAEEPKDIDEKSDVKFVSVSKDADPEQVDKMADAIKASKDANVGNGFSEKLAKAEEAVRKAQDKVTQASKKVNGLKEKMKNANVFKKIGLGVAYGVAKAALKAAELVLQIAINKLEALRKLAS